MSESQLYINWAIGAGGLIVGWYIRLMWSEIKLLNKADKELTDKIASIEVLVAGDYAKRDWIEGKLDRLFSILDGINKKLDGKADK